LNSSLVSAYYYLVLTGEGIRTGGGFHTYPETIRDLPILRLENVNERQYNKLISLVQRMLDLQKQQQAASSEASRERLQQEINVTDEQIDALVYELYGLTAEEIRIVEGG